ncbi:MAG: hypothetical protein ACMUEM_06565 [Flavobacteriales bacterium AspAUS03]
MVPFKKEEIDEAVKYGLINPIEDKISFNMIVYEWRVLWKDATKPRLSFITRLKYIFYPPASGTMVRVR